MLVMELLVLVLPSQAAPSLACRPHDEHDEPHGPAQGVDAIDHGLALALRCLHPDHANKLLVLQSQVAPSQAAPSLAMMCWALALALARSWALPLAWAILLALGTPVALPAGAGLALPLALRRLGLPQGCLQPPLATLARAA